MKKLPLKIEELNIQTFETAPVIEARGTLGGAHAGLLGTRVTRCYSECTACTNTEGIDCMC